ncbi:DUF1702 family protein [Paenibacillus chitinolyticus]|uniref:DUF1702 family protein n=1 Tax=Paenibacillus chitinolyticus TaxID=79263 RepID=UPI002DBF28B5|nr:DUF1702 family protein [Paenibacillus chitinolyticus]MEC0248484.1 DUF1702 family protein [Paenibacillus chitinolyticus]
MTVFGLLLPTAVLALLIYVRICHQNIGRITALFPWKQEFFDRRFQEILRAFLSGNNYAVNPLMSISGIRRRLDRNFEPFYRGFAYEGAGMGLGARASLFGPWKGKKFERYLQELDPGHIYQYYVGLGWWLHARYGFRTSAYRNWVRKIDASYAPILFDGVGFKTGLFEYKQNPDCIDPFNAFNRDEQRVCYQGFGRSLWFQNRFEIGPVLAEIDRLPEPFRGDALSGVGLAVAYSMFDNLAVILKAYRLVPDSGKASFAQGMAFGWETRRLQDREHWRAVLDRLTFPMQLKIEGWVAAVHQARKDAEAGQPESHYVRWIDRTRHLLQNQLMEGEN